ncbi:MAG: hypothetical protein JWO09_607 [Bacteroidetes bacterium]|nr:hypothetical protein [Bacteroidota bacterium]
MLPVHIFDIRQTKPATAMPGPDDQLPVNLIKFSEADVVSVIANQLSSPAFSIGEAYTVKIDPF